MEQQDGATGVATVAKEQAGQVGQTAADAGGQVAQTTKEQAQNVVGEARQQARDLVHEARTQVRSQAGTQKGRAVEGLRSLGDELHQMAQQGGGQSGIAAEVARQAADRAHGLAQYLDRHEPADLLDEVRAYARRRPVVFLTGAAIAGVVAGRLTRSLASQGDNGPAALPAGRTQGLTGGYGTGYDTGYGSGYSTGTAAAAGYQTEPTEVYDPGYQPPAPLPVDPAPAYPGSPVSADPTYPATPADPGYEDTGYDPAAPGTSQPTGDAYQQGYDQGSERDQPPSRGWTP